MTQIPSRILRRLDDGRVVYRLHLRAKAVVLTSAECERVEGMAKWSYFLQVFLALGIWLSAAVAFFNPSIRLFAIALTLILLVVVTLVERGYTRAMASILDRAPVSATDNVEPRPSIAQIARLIARQFFSAISDRRLRNLMIGLGAVLLAALWRVVADVLGIDSPQPAMSGFHVVLILLVCPLALHVLFAERRRRATEKRKAENAVGA
ncbi:hypothetical protein [Shinella sp.]|uniref:hypothetical protein n=1 Tax=Shinella sp. TaxID=1870904 RepID=UPI0040375D6E